MGVPVIANEGIGDVAALLKEAQAGVVVKSWNDLEELAQQWDPNRFDRSAIRDYAVRNFGLEVGVQQYFNVYNATSHA
jgi:glycosyltransferase involved in cell wall biosynthesis